MSENYNILIEEDNCRYCLANEHKEDLISPCKCTGSSKYVHKKCLKEWFYKSQSNPIIPGFFNQFNFKCEICHTRYNIEYGNTIPKSKLWFQIFNYIFIVTALLVFSYIFVGITLNNWSSTKYLFLKEGYSDWEYIFCNGFIFVHVILAIFYIISVIVFSMSDTGDNGICLCCWVGDCDMSGDCNGEGCFIFLIILLAIGIIGTVLLVYFDVISRVVQRYNNNSKTIIDIMAYSEEH